MAFPNEKFQIYFNHSPYLKKENTDSYNQYQTTSYDQHNMISYNGYQGGSRYINDGYTSTLMQRRPSFSPRNIGYSSTQAFDLYAPETETIDCYKETQSSTQIFSEDDDEKPLGSALSTHSKKIHKENFKGKSSKKNLLLKAKTKRNPWQPEEDEQVIELVAKYGQSWALIASLMKERSGKQIRDRYLNKLKPDINKAEWTSEEDELVMTLCREFGHKWSRIATYLPGRTEGQVKNRFYSHIKKRMGKWTGPSAYIKEKLMEEENTDKYEDSQVKEESMSFGLKTEVKPNKSIQMLNCAGDYKIVNSMEEKAGLPKLCTSSLNIKLNKTFDSKDGQKSVIYNLIPAKNISAKDPTDVISYTGGKESTSTADELNSPFSQKSEIQLASTRASSLSQEKEFEEAYDKLSSSIKAPVRSNKLHGISFNITNGAFTSNPLKPTQELSQKTVIGGGNSLSVKNLKEINQLNFSGVNNMINIKIC